MALVVMKQCSMQNMTDVLGRQPVYGFLPARPPPNSNLNNMPRQNHRGGPAPPVPPLQVHRVRASSQPVKTPVKTAGTLQPRGQASESPGRDRAYQPGAQPKVPMGLLNDMLLKVVEDLQPREEEIKRHAKAFAMVKELLLERWPDAEVHLFGSTANGLSITGNNDLDICLEIPNLIDEQVRPSTTVRLAVWHPPQT